MNLSKSIKVTVVEAAASAGTSDLTTDVLDMSGFEGVLFIALLGDVTAASVLTLTAKGNTADSVSSPTPVTQKATAPFTAGASDADSKAIILDLYKPTLRYQFAVLSRADQNAVVGGIIAIQYGAHNKPTAHHASVIASALGLGVSA